MNRHFTQMFIGFGVCTLRSQISAFMIIIFFFGGGGGVAWLPSTAAWIEKYPEAIDFLCVMLLSRLWNSPCYKRAVICARCSFGAYYGVAQISPHILIAGSDSALCPSCRCGKNQETKGTSGGRHRVTWPRRESTRWSWKRAWEARRATSPSMTSRSSLGTAPPLVIFFFFLPIVINILDLFYDGRCS